MSTSVILRALTALAVGDGARLRRVDPVEAAATIETMKQEVEAEAASAAEAHEQAALSKDLSEATVKASEAFTLRSDAARELAKTEFIMSTVGEADSRAKKAVHEIDESVEAVKNRISASSGMVSNAVQVALEGSMDTIKSEAKARTLAKYPPKDDGPPSIDPKKQALADAMQPYHLAILRAQREGAVLQGESEATLKQAKLEEAQGHWIAGKAKELENQNLLDRAHEEMGYARAHMHNAENWQATSNRQAARAEKVLDTIGGLQTQEGEMGTYVNAMGPHYKR